MLLTVLSGCLAMGPAAKLACLGFSFFVFRVAILSPARKVLQEEPSLSWISAAGKDTQKESDRSFFRKWATSLEGAWGRMLKVWRPAAWARTGRAGRGVVCLSSSLLLLCQRVQAPSSKLQLHKTPYFSLRERSGLIQPAGLKTSCFLACPVFLKSQISCQYLKIDSFS